MLQYRAAAFAGFATQCWWGFIKVMVFAAFFHSSLAHQPLSFAQAVTYTWLGQAFLALLPWSGDPEIAELVRSGNVSYERLRPLDTYFYWYVRAMAFMFARAAPRAAMMFALASLILPLIGFGAWRLRAAGHHRGGAALHSRDGRRGAAVERVHDADQYCDRRDDVRSRRQRARGAAGDSAVRKYRAAAVLSRGNAALPVSAAVRRTGRYPLSHLLRESVRRGRAGGPDRKC